MAWLQLRLRLQPNETAPIEEWLSTLGAVSVTLQDAADQAVFQEELGSTPLWNATEVVGLFPQDADLDAVLSRLELECGLQLQGRAVCEELPEENWERSWMDSYQPIRFGTRLWVCPGWLTPPDPEAVNLMLDPGLAFGTGTHPTTALCLEWLDSQALDGSCVVDYGCGSGILAIAAALLGAGRVFAIDNDPQAVTACRNNRERNGLDERLLTAHLPDEVFPQTDFLLANILAGPLEELAPLMGRMVREGGRIALSGILKEQGAAVREAYDPWFEMADPVAREDWLRLEGIRR